MPPCHIWDVMTTAVPPLPKRLLVRRRLKPRDNEQACHECHYPVTSKTMIVTRRIRPGETMELEHGGTVTMPSDCTLVRAVPQTIVLSKTIESQPWSNEIAIELKLKRYRRYMKDVAEAKYTEERRQRKFLDRL